MKWKKNRKIVEENDTDDEPSTSSGRAGKGRWERRRKRKNSDDSESEEEILPQVTRIENERVRVRILPHFFMVLTSNQSGSLIHMQKYFCKYGLDFARDIHGCKKLTSTPESQAQQFH